RRAVGWKQAGAPALPPLDPINTRPSKGVPAAASSWPENVGVCLVELAGLISVWQCPTAMVSVVGVMPGLTPLIIRRLCSGVSRLAEVSMGKRCPGPAVHGE